MTRNAKLTFLALALVWLALRVPHFSTHYSFNWDSSQFARGISEFNVIKHQPHPPGYPLFVLSARVLAPIAGGPMQAQIVVAFLMTLLALAVFYALARQFLDIDAALSCTILLAYSPAVVLNSSISSPSIADLASSAVAGHFAFLDPRQEKWRIPVCLAALSVLAGFRQSGAGLLAPLVAVAALMHCRYAWRAVCAGVVLAVSTFLAWYVPLAQSVGGWHALSRLTSEHFRNAAHGSSILFGAPPMRHLGMIGENIIYYGMNLCAWLVALGIAFHWRKALPHWWRYVLWLAPSLIMVFAIHGARVGQCLQTLPPLLLLLAVVGRPRRKATLAGILLSLAICYFPYGRFLSTKYWMAFYLPYRSTPRMALDLESSQRRLDRALRELQRSGAPQPFVCARNLPEAPNIRTATFDFPYVNWVLPSDSPRQPSIWLFDQHGPDPNHRARYQDWQRLSGDELISLWKATP